ncbi:response regulator [Pseudomonas knackmussii]|uniref:response regulator n=1 Tax=Pseudomonas knackmussii TaxID=65741 RepID=UPI003BCA15A6
MPTRIILVDDHPITLIGMRCLLEADPRLTIVGQAQDADGLQALLKTHACDLLITDLMLAGAQQADGLQMIQRVRRHYPQLPVIVVTMLDHPALVRALLDLGLRGLVSKRGLLTDLPRAILNSERKPFLSHSFEQQLRRVADQTGETPVCTTLSPREVEVLRLFGGGMTVGEIAGRLNRSKQTISSQKCSAMRKLGLDTNAALYLYLQETGLAHAPAC